MVKSKFTDAELIKMGCNLMHKGHYFVSFDRTQIDKEQAAIKGKFKNVIDYLFSSNDGSLDNGYLNSVSENAPESVKSFIRNVLLCDVPALKAAPDAQTALDTLIPRTAQTSAEIAPYLDMLAGIVNESVQQHNSSE